MDQTQGDAPAQGDEQVPDLKRDPFDLRSLQRILQLLAEGDRKAAVQAVSWVDTGTPEELEVVRHALGSDGPDAVVARHLGDRLHSMGFGNDLVNEAYRVAFYLSGKSEDLIENPLYSYFLAHRSGAALDKWIHYFPIYHRYLERFRRRPVRILEVGVYRGGGLQMWRWYFGGDATLVGVDIDPAAKEAVAGAFAVELGDQSDPEFLRCVEAEHGPFDVVIDDGGHTMTQQRVTVETLFPLLADDGILLVEDCHTSYWPEYDGGLRAEGTFVEWAKSRVDDMHSRYSRSIDPHTVWATHLDAMHVHDSVVVLEKRERFRPFSEMVGTSAFLRVDRPSEGHLLDVIASRDVARARVDHLEREVARLRSEWGPQTETAEPDPALARQEKTKSRLIGSGLRSGRIRQMLGQVPRPLVLEAVANRVTVETGEGADPSGSSKVAIVAQHSHEPRVSRSLFELVRRLHGAGYHCVITSTCERPERLSWPGEIPEGTVVLRRPNVGYDFGSWAVALDRYQGIAASPHVILTNDSLVGPFAPITHLLAAFESSKTNVWSLTDSNQIERHMQSYFVGFRGGLLAEDPLKEFFRNIRVEHNKMDVVHRYELGLSRLCSAAGYSSASAVASRELGVGVENPTLAGWQQLLDAGVPFVKRTVISDPTTAPDAATVGLVVRERFGEDLTEWL